MDNKKIIGSRINSALAMNNTLQKELAKQLNVKDNIVSYWCKGDRTPNTTQIIQIANCLNVSTDYLLGLTDVATNDKDLKFVCEYTGLNENSINFFHFNNSIKELTNFNKEAIDFLQFLISKIKLNSSFSINIYNVRADTNVLVEAYEKSIQKRKNGFAFLSEDEIDDFNNLSVDAKIQFLLNDKDSEVKLDDLDTQINGLKYKLSKFLDNCLDEFAVSASGYTVFELNELENEYYRGNKPFD